MAQNARTLFQLFSTNSMGKAPSVRGFRTSPPSTPTSSSDIRLNRMENLSQSRANSHHNARSASPLRSVQQASTPPLPPVAIRATLIKVQMPVNASWLHGQWKPGHVLERIAAFERLAAQQSGATSSRSSASVIRVEAKQQEPTPPTAKRQAPKTPPVPVPAPTRSTSVLEQTVTPPAEADASNLLGRSNTFPQTAQLGKDLFAELAAHPLVRSRATAESTGDTSEMESSDRQKATSPPEVRRLNPFQLDLRKQLEKREPIKPIAIKPEVQRQADELRKQRETERNAAMRDGPGKGAEPATPESGRSVSDTINKDLIAELKEVQRARASNVQSRRS
ncbi:hypothetical protein [Stenotrophomonas sp.]|uniref:hypothetical protein n=1 Tax=Stenotrophomonas sp. TaxID=69392 RepID=UPI00289C3825|nr:hypothetical protein [Stenotrophomonas sp.]